MAGSEPVLARGASPRWRGGGCAGQRRRYLEWMLGLRGVAAVWGALACGCWTDNPGFVTEAAGSGGASGGSSASGTGSATTTTTAAASTTDAPTSTSTSTSSSTSTDPSTGDATAGGTSGSTGSTTAPPPACGDGIVDPGEACDDANADNTDECTNNCTIAVCGDGFVQAGMEACDDGNDDETDLCTTKCEHAACGDGFVQEAAGEDCDPTNDVSFDGCAECKQTCGDGKWSADEEECEPGVMPFANEFAGMCQDGCKIKSCYRFTNKADTADVDGGADWFKPCAGAGGIWVAVTLIDSLGVKFLGVGKKPAGWTWTLDYLTCPTPICNLSNQSIIPNHSKYVLLKDFFSAKNHVFVAFGRGTTPPMVPMCPTSLADGFGFVLIPEFDVLPSLVAMPFMGTNSARNFAEWDKSKELSFNGGQGMNLCQPGGLKGYLGTVVVSVF